MSDFEIPASDYIDTVFFWESQVDSKSNRCRARIFWITWEKAVVILTDLDRNPGRNVADVTKGIIYFATHLYNLAPNKIMLIEHYPQSSLKKDVYLQVLLRNNEAFRYSIAKSKLTELIGKPI